MSRQKKDEDIVDYFTVYSLSVMTTKNVDRRDYRDREEI